MTAGTAKNAGRATRRQLLAEIENLRARLARFERTEHDHLNVETALRTERLRLFALLDGLPAFIYLQAGDYSVRFANRAFRDRFGEPGDRPCYEIMNGSQSPCAECPTFKVFTTNKPQTWEWKWHDNETYRIYDYPFYDNDGTPLVLELGIDITDQKQLEKIRSELFADVSHELRTPLMKIQGYVEALRDGLYAGEGEFRQYLEIIYLNTRGINRLLKDLFDLSKLEAGEPVALCPVSLTEILPQYFREIGRFVQQNGRLFHYRIVAPLPNVRADVDRLIQVLNNLVGNAVKFTAGGGRIDVTVQPHPAGIIVEVADDGPGIPEADQPHIFAKFYKSKSGKSGQSSGLGLAIVRSIVHAHGGTVWVQSTPGLGARFFFTLPAAES
jgi:PAS domain-containing protein